MIDYKEIHSVDELSNVGWTQEDTSDFLYCLNRILSMSLSPEWVQVLLDGDLENPFVASVLVFFINRYWIFRKSFLLEHLQDSVGFVIARQFSLR